MRCPLKSIDGWGKETAINGDVFGLVLSLYVRFDVILAFLTANIYEINVYASLS